MTKLTESKETRNQLMRVALGETEADLAIVNGDVLNVYTGEVLSGDTVLIKGGKIAYVGKSTGRSIGSSTEVIDADGKVLIPGFIDGHTHVDCIYSLGELSRYAMKGGTTTIISQADMLVFPLGYQGIMHFLRNARNQPVKILATIPPMVVISKAVEEHAITVDQLRRLLRPDEDRHQQTQAQGSEQKVGRKEQEGEEAAAEGYVEPVDHEGDAQQHAHKAGHQVRHELTDHEFRPTDGSGDQLLERPVFLLPRQRHRGQNPRHPHHHRQECWRVAHEWTQSGVVPRAHPQVNG